MKPKLPHTFDSPIFFHFLRWIFLSFYRWDHQNRAMDAVISLHSFFERRNTLMVYIKMACITTFNNIFFSSQETNELFQLWSLDHILFFSFPKFWYLDLPTVEGKPKYLGWSLLNETLAVAKTMSLVSWLVWELKNIEIFYLFRHCLKASS